MRFPCTIERRADGRWAARHQSADVGDVAVNADSREQAIEKIVGEIRYRLEMCPCSGASYQHVDIELVEKA